MTQTMPDKRLHDGVETPIHSDLLYTPLAQRLSLLVTAVLGLLLSIFPQLVMPAGRAPDHVALMLCLWGMVAGFVHGVGFVPRHHMLRILLGPRTAWTMMPLGLYLMRVWL